jgi:hypothetical protein
LYDLRGLLLVVLLSGCGASNASMATEATPSPSETPTTAAVIEPAPAKPVPASDSQRAAVPATPPVAISATTEANKGAPRTFRWNDETRVTGREGFPCRSSATVQRVVGARRTDVQRKCWDNGASTKVAANVAVFLTIMNDGSTQGVSASGDEPAVAACIANDARSWRFPKSLGCSLPVGVAFHFVRR